VASATLGKNEIITQGQRLNRFQDETMRSLLSLFWLLCVPCLAYDPQFSRIIDSLHSKYHQREGDWVDQLKSQIAPQGEIRDLSFIDLEKAGVDPDYLDALALEYCEQHKDCFISIVWPTVNYTHEKMIYDVLSEHGLVAYRKKFVLQNNGPLTVLEAIPEKAPTIKDHFSFYFPPELKEYPMMLFVLRSQSAEEITISKKKVREILNIYPFSIHVNDIHWQAMDLARLLLNNNSIHFLNHHKREDFKTFNSLLPSYVNFLKERQVNEWDSCVDGSSVLSAYGIRDCSVDFDFLNVKTENFGTIFPLDHHNIAWTQLGFDIKDIIYNPKNFFYFKNVKFVSLPATREFKAKQGRERDIADVALMDEFLK